MQQIADRIERRRVELGLSETKLAAQSGMARMTLTRRLANPGDFTIQELDRLAATLGTTSQYLMLGTEDAA